MKTRRSGKSLGRIRKANRRRCLNAAVIVSVGTTAIHNVAVAQELEEVVVSATRRQENIQDVPYSISAISSQALDNNHVESISDLTHMIAGVSFVDQGPTSRSNFVLRGINANSTDHPSSNTVPPVSTYIGETPLFIPLQIDDIERVEVLRGPQGTLYGSGSLAGTIRFIPKEPDTSGFHASINGDVGTTDEASKANEGTNGMINIPFSGTMAMRVAAGYQHYAGFIDERYIVRTGPPSTALNSPVGIPVSADPSNPTFGPLAFNPQKDANDADLWHVRASFLFKPTDQFKALLTYYHQDSRQYGVQAISPGFGGNIDTPASQNPYYSPGYPVSFPTGGVVFPRNGTYDTNDSFLLSDHRHTDLGTLDVSYDFGFASLSSSTSYYTDIGNNAGDNTGELTQYASFYGFLPRLVDYEHTDDSLKGAVEELRLVSRPGKYLDYVVGLFYQNPRTDSQSFQWIPGQTYYGNLIGYPGDDYQVYGDENTLSYSRTTFKDRAAFGELTWHITDRWQATGGVRKFKQSFELNTSTAFPYCGLACSNIGDLGGTTLVKAGYSVNSQIFKFNTAYKINEWLNSYFNYAEGFRRGGSTGIPTSGPFAGNPALLIYKPDKTKNFEVGLKGAVGKVNFSAALFYINWDNFQADASAIASGFGIAVNGDKARSRGGEFEVSGELLPRLTYDLGYSYSLATIASNFNVYDLNTSKEMVAIVTGRYGDPLPNSPKNSATMALDYTQPAPFLDKWNLRWHLDGNYRSATISQLESTDPNAVAPFKIAGFTLWDASANFASAHGVYTNLYVQNIFNQLGITGGENAERVGPRAAHYYITRPRTIGLKVGYEF